MKTINELHLGDITKLSDDDIRGIATAAANNVNVLIRDQNLSKPEYARILRLFGKNPKRDVWFEDKEHHEIMYVTNKKMCGDNGDKPGVFSRGELNWHQNGTMTLDPEDCVVLYCEEPSPTPCNTYFTNGLLAYESLTDDVKKIIDKTELMMSVTMRSFHKLDNPHFVKLKMKPINLDDEPVWTDVPMEEIAELWKIQDRTRAEGSAIEKEMLDKVEKYSDGGRWNFVFKPVVKHHIVSGKKGLYFPFSNVCGFHDVPQDEWADLHATLKKAMLDTCEAHEWRKGDLLLFDNTQGLHQRDNIPDGETRELWRAAFWYPTA